MISINHNWMNGACVDRMWAHLSQEMEDVKRALSGFEFTSDIENVSLDDAAAATDPSAPPKGKFMLCVFLFAASPSLY